MGPLETLLLAISGPVLTRIGPPVAKWAVEGLIGASKRAMLPFAPAFALASVPQQRCRGHLTSTLILPGAPISVSCTDRNVLPPARFDPTLAVLVGLALCAVGVAVHARLRARALHRAEAENSAATRLQSLSRMRRACLFLRRCCGAVLRLQAACRARAAITAAAATSIQKEARRFIAYTAYTAMLGAAVRLQSAVRRWRVGGYAAAAADARSLVRGELSAAHASLSRRMLAVVRLETAARRLEASCCVEAALRLTRIGRGHLARVHVAQLRAARAAKQTAVAKAHHHSSLKEAAYRRTTGRGRHVAVSRLIEPREAPYRQLNFSPSPASVPPPPAVNGAVVGPLLPSPLTPSPLASSPQASSLLAPSPLTPLPLAPSPQAPSLLAPSPPPRMRRSLVSLTKPATTPAVSLTKPTTTPAAPAASPAPAYVVASPIVVTTVVACPVTSATEAPPAPAAPPAPPTLLPVPVPVPVSESALTPPTARSALMPPPLVLAPPPPPPPPMATLMLAPPPINRSPPAPPLPSVPAPPKPKPPSPPSRRRSPLVSLSPTHQAALHRSHRATGTNRPTAEEIQSAILKPVGATRSARDSARDPALPTSPAKRSARDPALPTSPAKSSSGGGGILNELHKRILSRRSSIGSPEAAPEEE